MNREDAKERMLELIGPAASLLTESDIDLALDRSLTWDTEGRRPGDDGYIESYDPFWAAAEGANLLAVRAQAAGGVVKFSSEGSTFERTAPDFWSLARYLRSLSPMSPWYGTSLGVLNVDGTLSDFRPATDEYQPESGIIGNWS